MLKHVESASSLGNYSDKPLKIEIEETNVEGILKHMPEFDAYWLFHYLAKVPREWEEKN